MNSRDEWTAPLFCVLIAVVLAGAHAVTYRPVAAGPHSSAAVPAGQTEIILAQIEEGDIDQSFEAYGDDSDEMFEKDEPVMAPVDSLVEGIAWLGHASFLIEGAAVIYIDPYDIPRDLANQLPKADLILVTHDHTDHFSPGDIDKLARPPILSPAEEIPESPTPDVEEMDRKPATTVISIKPVIERLPEGMGHFYIVAPGDTIVLGDIVIEAVPAYNIDKKFHPRDKGYVGYVIHMEDRTVYHAGDTDLIPEMKSIDADVALLPVGGKFTMDPIEAAEAADIIQPRVAIPMHWGKIIGTWEDAKEFQARCKTRVVVLTDIAKQAKQ